MEELEALSIKDLLKTADGFPLLFADYLSEYHRVQQFFEVDFHNPKNFPIFAKQVCERFGNREEIADILLEQNQSYRCSRQTLDNIQLFRNPTTVAIVTGQQVGILSGPLYTLYKTITAIKL